VVGKKVAKDFGSQGVFIGEVISVVTMRDKKHFFTSLSTPTGITGIYRKLSSQIIALDDEKDVALNSGTDEDESYRPSPKVFSLIPDYAISFRRSNLTWHSCL
jgi:hypothetical protein